MRRKHENSSTPPAYAPSSSCSQNIILQRTFNSTLMLSYVTSIKSIANSYAYKEMLPTSTIAINLDAQQACNLIIKYIGSTFLNRPINAKLCSLLEYAAQNYSNSVEFGEVIAAMSKALQIQGKMVFNEHSFSILVKSMICIKYPLAELSKLVIPLCTVIYGVDDADTIYNKIMIYRAILNSSQIKTYDSLAELYNVGKYRKYYQNSIACIGINDLPDHIIEYIVMVYNALIDYNASQWKEKASVAPGDILSHINRQASNFPYRQFTDIIEYSLNGINPKQFVSMYPHIVALYSPTATNISSKYKLLKEISKSTFTSMFPISLVSSYVRSIDQQSRKSAFSFINSIPTQLQDPITLIYNIGYSIISSTLENPINYVSHKYSYHVQPNIETTGLLAIYYASKSDPTDSLTLFDALIGVLNVEKHKLHIVSLIDDSITGAISKCDFLLTKYCKHLIKNKEFNKNLQKFVDKLNMLSQDKLNDKAFDQYALKKYMELYQNIISKVRTTLHQINEDIENSLLELLYSDTIKAPEEDLKNQNTYAIGALIKMKNHLKLSGNSLLSNDMIVSEVMAELKALLLEHQVITVEECINIPYRKEYSNDEQGIRAHIKINTLILQFIKSIPKLSEKQIKTIIEHYIGVIIKLCKLKSTISFTNITNELKSIIDTNKDPIISEYHPILDSIHNGHNSNEIFKKLIECILKCNHDDLKMLLIGQAVKHCDDSREHMQMIAMEIRNAKFDSRLYQKYGHILNVYK